MIHANITLDELLNYHTKGVPEEFLRRLESLLPKQGQKEQLKEELDTSESSLKEAKETAEDRLDVIQTVQFILTQEDSTLETVREHLEHPSIIAQIDKDWK